MARELTVDMRKKLIAKYPYLMPRNAFSGKPVANFDYSFIVGEYSLPEGWMELFLQCCEDIYKPLKKIDYVDKFYFTQTKEKYGRMELYSYGTTNEIQTILNKYRFLSEQVCCICGIPANAVTWGYVAPFCREHLLGQVDSIEDAEIVEIKTSYMQDTFGLDGHKQELVDCSDEWNRYLERIGYKNEA